ncbi:hypothetical protein [Aquisphaera insulae]|uniref:hypothetical protein n=1 Tax=Aquisphaera insulae TaxID=2712864 RepID=UPI0013ECFFA2|nr:hypothetical protein [Aquisphaera insulae]
MPGRPIPTPVKEHHPDLGEVIASSWTRLWTSRRVTSEGRELLLAGRGNRPSDWQVRLWRSIEARLPELIAEAVAAVPEPPTLPRKCTFSRDDLTLREVCVEGEDTFDLYFDTPLGDRIDMWPVVTFSGWGIRGCEWAC